CILGDLRRGPASGVDSKSVVFRDAGTTFDRRTITAIYASRSYQAAPDGDPYPALPGHPHPPSVAHSVEPKPERLDRLGIRLDWASPREFVGDAGHRPGGSCQYIGFFGLRLRRGPRRDPLAVLPRQHLESADRRECRLRPGEHQEAHGLRDDERCRRPHPHPGRPGHGCVEEQRRWEGREPVERPGDGPVFLNDSAGAVRPGGRIRHALKVNLFGADDYCTGYGSYRWPATTADGCAPGCYGGSVPALRMGSLLALPPSIDVNSMGLETNASKILAHTFQDYGGYTVDDAAWSVYAIATEYSPSGKVDDEFTTAWGFPISPLSRDVPWARDMDLIFGALAVVDNWDLSTWQTVSASNGTQGAGLGAPRVPWAPDFGPASPDTVPPVTTYSASGSSGASNWYTSSVTVTLTATDDS